MYFQQFSKQVNPKIDLTKTNYRSFERLKNEDNTNTKYSKRIVIISVDSGLKEVYSKYRRHYMQNYFDNLLILLSCLSCYTILQFMEE